MSSTISPKTIGYITYLLKSELPEVFAELPKHDLKHTDERVDFSRLILEKHLEILTHNYAQTLINLINKHDKEAVRQFIYGLTLPNF